MFKTSKHVPVFQNLLGKFQKCARFHFLSSLKIVQFQIFVHKFKNMFLFSHFWKYVRVFKFCLGISRNVPVSKQIPWFSKIFSFKFLFCKLAIYLCFIDPFVFSIKNDFEIQDIIWICTAVWFFNFGAVVESITDW